MTTHLARIFEHLPIPDARENRDLPGPSTNCRKRRDSASSSDPEEDSSPRHKTSNNDVDAISVIASEEDVNELLSNSEPGATIDSQTDVNDGYPRVTRVPRISRVAVILRRNLIGIARILKATKFFVFLVVSFSPVLNSFFLINLHETYLWRFEWIITWKMNIEEKHSSFVN